MQIDLLIYLVQTEPKRWDHSKR